MDKKINKFLILVYRSRLIEATLILRLKSIPGYTVGCKIIIVTVFGNNWF